jgi:hypothetical protein
MSVIANSVLRNLRDGAWLTAARARRWSVAFLLGYLAFEIVLILTSHKLSDFAGRPVGSDFSSFYSASRLALAGGSPYDQKALYQMEREIFGIGTPYYGFSYPPIFLLLLCPFAVFSYAIAFAAWQLVTFGFYVGSMLVLRKRAGRHLSEDACFLPILAFTAVFVNLVSGQNGFVMAGLFALAFAFLAEQPLMSGFFFGLIAIKPQLGILIPLALLAGRHWKAFGGAAITVMILTATSSAVFGISSWGSFINATVLSRQMILDEGGVGYGKMISVFSAARLLGASLSLSYIAQALVTFCVAVVVAAIWIAKSDHRLAGAFLCLGTLLATPFALDYDMMMLAPAGLMLVSIGIERGFLPYQKSVMAWLWVMPMLARGAVIIKFPFGILSLLFFFVVMLLHHKGDMRKSPDMAGSICQ